MAYTNTFLWGILTQSKFDRPMEQPRTSPRGRLSFISKLIIMPFEADTKTKTSFISKVNTYKKDLHWVQPFLQNGDQMWFINKTESSSDFNRHQESLSTFQNTFNTAKCILLVLYQIIASKYSIAQNVQYFMQMNQMFKCSFKCTKC